MYVINNPVYVPECPSKKSQFERLKEAFFNKLSANKKRVETLRNEVQERKKRIKGGNQYTSYHLIVLYLLWIGSGTVFYSIYDKFGWAKGFYMAVNVGYSVGWGNLYEVYEESKLFSVIYVLIGSSAVAAAVGYFAQNMIEKSSDWYTKALDEAELKADNVTWYMKIYRWCDLHSSAIRMVGVWVVWVFALAGISWASIGWTFMDGLYFAVASYSTGGLWAIPADSPGWRWVITGVFTATGVPIMAMAMAHIASGLIDLGDAQSMENILGEPVTDAEIEMMKVVGLQLDAEGSIDKAGFILLCALRLGIMSPDLIQKINDTFEDLDVDGDHTLSVSELKLTQPRKQPNFDAMVIASDDDNDNDDVEANNNDENEIEMKRKENSDF